MPIDPTTATTTAGAAGQPGRSTPASDTFGTDTFLQLMVAQLKYQNPLSPTDGTEFLAQSAQFTMVEKLNQLTDQSTDLLITNRSLTAAALLGQQVSWADDTGEIRQGTVTGARLGSAGPTLLIDDGSAVPLDLVREVTAG